MNEIDLVNADLHDEAEGFGSVEAVVTAPVTVEDETVANEALTTALKEHVANRTDNGDGTSSVSFTPKPKSGAGRKVDTTGSTALGAARLLYAANPTLGTKELRALFVQELGPKFKTSEQVAQTYVSLVRKPKGKKVA